MIHFLTFKKNYKNSQQLQEPELDIFINLHNQQIGIINRYPI